MGPARGSIPADARISQSLTLPLLNRATQAWVELEYNRSHHSELGDSPLGVALTAPSVGRPAPESQVLRRAFRTQQSRAQRTSDGTIVVHGVRFELPSRYRTLRRPTVRFARWDLSSIAVVDPRSEQVLCELYPLDKRANAEGKRRVLQPRSTERSHRTEIQPDEWTGNGSGIAPLLQTLMADYAATGLPPAYIPHHTESGPTNREDD